MSKIKGLDNWVDSYNQPAGTTKYVMTKPKYIYVVILSNENRMQIAGCFYSKAKAERYSGFSANTFVQKLEVA